MAQCKGNVACHIITHTEIINMYSFNKRYLTVFMIFLYVILIDHTSENDTFSVCLACHVFPVLIVIYLSLLFVSISSEGCEKALIKLNNSADL